MVATRSSLELMLDKLQQVEDQPSDIPPALPVRPVSRARMPRRRKPLQLDFQRRNSEENAANSKRMKNEGMVVVVELLENVNEEAEKGVSNIQRWYRGHRVRCYYKDLRRGVIELQSFIRGENARTGYNCRSRSALKAVMVIQNQTRRYLECRAIEQQQAEARTKVEYTVLADLEKRVLRTEAKVRGRREENIGLKMQLEEMEKKWKHYDERMKLMEKGWQDQFSYIQECLAAANKKNPISVAFDEDSDDVTEVGLEQKPGPNEELRKLKTRFKAWKKEYKNKLREARSAFKKLANSSKSTQNKYWWGRLSN